MMQSTAKKMGAQTTKSERERRQDIQVPESETVRKFKRAGKKQSFVE